MGNRIVGYGVTFAVIVSLTWLFGNYLKEDNQVVHQVQREETAKIGRVVIINRKESEHEFEQMRDWLIDIEKNQIILRDEVNRR